MSKQEKQPVRGLESVVAANTRLSYVDGANGKLFYCGYDIDDLAGRVTFEEVTFLLWHNRLPNAEELKEFCRELISEMRIPTQVFEMLKLAPPSANPMVILRTAISAMGMFDLDGGINTEEANARKARRILAQVATIVSALCRCRAGLPVLSPDTNMGFAANFLYMLHGKEPSLLAAKAMDMLMVLHADHGLAASTFAARVTVSTLAGMHSAITAALASLKGPLHGGANRKVMEMLEEIGEPKDVEEYIESLLNSGQRIMGFGHRIYKTEDPRSRHLKQISEKLCPLSGMERMIETSQRIEKTVHERKGIFPNVDFYSATVQKALELPMDFYVCIFAMARTAGWIAHIMEQFDDNRLIRPTSNYIGGFYRKLNPI